jgi:hypothetical protein
MKYLLYITLTLVSCQPKEKQPLDGTWKFERNELFPGVEINAFQDSLLQMLAKQQEGLTLQFSGKNFKVIQIKNGQEEKMGDQPYELSADKKSLILKNTGRPDDVFPIVLLTDSILKLNMFLSNEGYLVFRKDD